MNEEESQFEKRLILLINEFSQENGSDTPDFILAKYMFDSLLAFNRAVSNRTEWHERCKEYESALMEGKTVVVEVGDAPVDP